MSKYTEQSTVERLSRNRTKVNMEKKTITRSLWGNSLLRTVDFLVKYHHYRLIY